MTDLILLLGILAANPVHPDLPQPLIGSMISFISFSIAILLMVAAFI